jgi:Mn2+/Fe2+ NRAMP family transporter
MTKSVSSPYSSLIPSRIDRDFLFLVAANVGAVVIPFMLFYQTTATAKKAYSLAGSWGVVEALNLKGNTWFKLYIAESLPAVVLVFFSMILSAWCSRLWLR